MAFSVVCISHTEESGGKDIARAVALGLGYRFVDDEIILRAARTAKVDPEVVAAAERKQPFLARIFEAIAAATAMSGSVTGSGAAPGDGSSAPATVGTQTEDLRSLIRQTIGEVARHGQAVIGAHAASHALAGTPGVLRVLITAPEQVRAARLAEDRDLKPSEAKKVIADSDAGREGYFRSFYKVKQELPTHYDLVLNTEVLTPGHVTALILKAARG